MEGAYHASLRGTRASSSSKKTVIVVVIEDERVVDATDEVDEVCVDVFDVVGARAAFTGAELLLEWV
jgi:hypothetical protein